MKYLKILFRIIRKILHLNYLYISVATLYSRGKKINSLQKNGQDALVILKDALNSIKCNYWLEFGTLLGAYRDQGFIKNDFDIDVGVYSNSNISEIDVILRKTGFEKIKEVKNINSQLLEISYKYKNVHIDIIIFYIINNKAICYLYTIPQETFKEIVKPQTYAVKFTFSKFELTEIPFLNSMYSIPKNVEIHLGEVYGDKFMERNQKWDDNMSPNRIVTLDKVIVKTY